MENNHQPTSDNPYEDVDVVICNSSSSSSSDEEEEQVLTPTTAESKTQVVHQSTTTRLYECSFCKKGFSNAQALGGHMNIHRKDKAKLKQKASTKPSHLHSKTNLPLTPSSNSSAAGNLTTAFATNKWLPYSSFTPHHHHHQEVFYERQMALSDPQQLPLFVETASTSADKEDHINYSNDKPINHHQQEVNQHQHQHQYHHDGVELDLELRLGQKPSKQTVDLGTRKFF